MEVEIYKMIYKRSNNTEKLRILGENFVKHNKNKGNIIINNKKEKIKSIIPIDNYKPNKIKIILIKNIYNISYMFKDCVLLESLSYITTIKENKIDDENIEDDIQVIDTENINSINNENNSINVKTISDDNTEYYWSDISSIKIYSETNESSLKINFNNLIDMSHMFSNCNSLKYIPDISQWKVNNTGNMVNMGYMFSNCSSLLSLPDISKWNTNNVINMSYIFSNCSSLLSLPDISKWNTNNVINMSYMFSNCKSIKSFQIFQNGILVI